MNDERRSVERMKRLVEVRQAYVTVAEANVREAEGVLKRLEDETQQNARQIQQAREEIAYLNSLTGSDIQARERYLLSLQIRAREIVQQIEKAKQELERKRMEWREAMKGRKVVERLGERRLQEWVRSVDVMEQKQVDEMTVGRHARDKSRSAFEPADATSPGANGYSAVNRPRR